MVKPVTRYKQIPNFEDYKIGTDGSVLSRKSGKWNRRQAVLKKGYLCVDLYRKGAQFQRSVHTLVLETFVGPCPKDQEGRHLDDDKWNNRLSNLCWGSRQSNIEDKIRNGRTPTGSKNHFAKLTKADVEKIRGSEERTTELASLFGVTRQTIWGIRRNKTWCAR